MTHLCNKIAVVVSGTTLESFLAQLERAQAVAEIIELRVDAITDLSSNDLAVIHQHTSKTAIVCCRAQCDGGQYHGDTPSQQGILQQANDLGFQYIDIDIHAADNIQIDNQQCQKIISYHNFNAMPDLSELTQIAQQMRAYKPEILKFAVMVNHESDIASLYHFLLQKRDEEKMIVIGMGKLGKSIRMVAPLLGSYLTFASIDGLSSAPGQIDALKMQEIYRAIEAELN